MESITTKGGKVFKFCGFEPYQRKDGEWTELKVWQSTCRCCKKLFTVKTPAGVTEFSQSHAFEQQNCFEHKYKK